MSDATAEHATVTPPPPPSPAERRERRDRRKNGEPGRRGRRLTFRIRFPRLARDLSAIVILIAAIAAIVSHVRPIYSGTRPLAQQISQRMPGSAVVGAMKHDSTDEERAVSAPGFEPDRKAFASDLIHTGRVDSARADSIAYYAVREAYIRGIPPAVIFGVMLTENAVFASNATSNVGAVGLMQVYPKVWLKELSKRFGKDLTTDSTNLKYGTFILSQYINPKGKAAQPGDVSKGLLRYNGCVRGTNTPHCTTYPSKVKTYVEREGESLCGDKSFYDCIAKPFMIGLLGKAPAAGAGGGGD
jgi:Transglycosylase SLT domain